MSAERNKAIVRRWYERGVGQGELALADELFAAEFGNEPSASGRRIGPAGVKRIVGELRSAVPDLSVMIEEMIAEGDTVVIRFTGSGTHRGAFRGIPPSGKAVRFTEVGFLRLREGRIVTRRVAFEGASLVEQLGAGVQPKGA
jgi:steroid delta-isomerase-like uncharacterized protein